MAEVFHDVQVERQDGLTAVRLECVELVEDGYLGEIAKRCGVSIAGVDLYDVFVWGLTQVTAYRFRATSAENL